MFQIAPERIFQLLFFSLAFFHPFSPAAKFEADIWYLAAKVHLMLQMLGFYKNQKKIITQTFQSANISTCQYWTSVESLHLAKFKVLPSFQTFYEYFKRFSARLWKNSLPWNSLASSTSASLSSTPDDSNDTHYYYWWCSLLSTPDDSNMILLTIS